MVVGDAVADVGFRDFWFTVTVAEPMRPLACAVQLASESEVKT